MLGILAGALGGWVDSLVMRIVDVMLSIPVLLLAFSIAALAPRPSQWTVIIAIAVIQVPIFARLLRGSMLAQRVSDHVLAARALGVSVGAVVFRHMLPNALGPVIVQATLVLAIAIIDAAALLVPRPRQPRRPPAGVGPDARRLARSSSTPTRTSPIYPAACIIVVALGLHADGRVVARGPRPEVAEVTGMTVRPSNERTRCFRQRPQRHLHPARRGAVQRRRRRLLRRPRRPDARPGRRVRLRQVRDVAGDHGSAARSAATGSRGRRRTTAPTC